MNSTPFFRYAVAGASGALVFSLLPTFVSESRAETKLLPFQGRLTDAAGAVITDGAKVVEFKMYDAPSGGSAKWAGEVHKLSVNGGLVNTMLGSKAGLGSVDFATPTFLQITVDADGDGQITAADPPLLPRQTIQPAVYASESGNSRQLAGADWSSILVDANGAASNTPSTGYINGAKIQPASVGSTKITDGAVTSAKLADNAISSADLAPVVRDALLPPGTILSYGGNSAPAGFVLCDGAAYARSGTYAPLFSAISTNFGAPDANSFNVPDLQGRFLRGVDGTAGRDIDKMARLESKPGGSTGNKVGSIQNDEVIQHSHNMGIGSAMFNLPSGSNNVFAAFYGYNSSNAPYDYSNGRLVSSYGGSETRPKNIYVNYIIKL